MKIHIIEHQARENMLWHTGRLRTNTVTEGGEGNDAYVALGRPRGAEVETQLCQGP